MGGGGGGLQILKMFMWIEAKRFGTTDLENRPNANYCNLEWHIELETDVLQSTKMSAFTLSQQCTTGSDVAKYITERHFIYNSESYILSDY